MITRYLTNLPGAESDNVVVYLPRLWKPNGQVPAIILCGGTDDAWQLGFSQNHVLPIARAVTDAGFALGWSDFGVNQYGNQNAQNRIGALRTYLQSSAVGARAGKVALGGFSMGGLNALNYAGNYPTNVMSFTGWCPLVDMQAAVDHVDILPYVQAAYPGGWTEGVNGATTNPQTMTAAGNYAGIPIELRYSHTDGLIPLSMMQAFANATVGTTVQITDTGAQGHSWETITNTSSLNALISQVRAAM